MIEPFEPIAVDRRPAPSHAIEFDEISRHMLLSDNEGNAAPGEAAQRLAPSRLRSCVHDVVRLRGVEIVALEPSAVGWTRFVGIGGDDLAYRRGHVIAREELDHAMAVGVADRSRPVDD